MRVALLVYFVLPVALAAACGGSSSTSGDDAGPLGDGGCLELTPTQGSPCTLGQVLCNPGSICCGGEWTCDSTTHKWNLLQGGCACPGDASVPVPDGGAEAGATSCSRASDCRTFSDYCGACVCDVLGTNNPSPMCDGGAVTCLKDPCMGHTATCDATHHCALQ